MKQRYLYFVLVLVSILPFISLLKGEFLYDDIEFIATNPDLARVETLQDCFSFEMQPSKPVTTFMVAFVHWVGGGTLWGHRLFSILLHMGVTLLLFTNLTFLSRRLKEQLPPAVLLGIPLLFALSPIHSETISIAQFRGEILAAFFSLIAIWMAQLLANRQRYIKQLVPFYLTLFLCYGLAILSKEVFAVILPVALLLFYLVPQWKTSLLQTQHRPFLAALIVTGLVWSIFLAIGVRQDATTNYTYTGNVGLGVMGIGEQIILSARALLEGLWKLITGMGLTTIQMSKRAGIGSNLSVFWACSVWIVFLLASGFVITRGKWSFLWGSLFLVSAGTYLIIPNKNIGSEHYWYFVSISFFSLLVFWVWKGVSRLSPQAAIITWSFVFLCATPLSLVLQNRLSQMETTTKFYVSEVDLHPEVAIAWVNAANVLMSKSPNFLLIAKLYIDSAKHIDPELRNVTSAEFVYAVKTGNLDAAEKLLTKIEHASWPPRDLSRFFYDIARLRFSQAHCKPADAAFSYAIELDPNNQKYQVLYEEFKQKSQATPALCLGTKN